MIQFESLNNKYHYQFKIGSGIMLLIGKKFKEEKERRYYEQDCKCLLCSRDLDPDIQKNHLDHDHALEGPNAGKVRGLLCNLCNVLEGQIGHKFVSSGLKSKDVDKITWLKSLIDYYEQDVSTNPVHPTFINDKTKQFSKCNIPEMDSMASDWNLEFLPKTTKSEKTKLFKVNLKRALK